MFRRKKSYTPQRSMYRKPHPLEKCCDSSQFGMRLYYLLRGVYGFNNVSELFKTLTPEQGLSVVNDPKTDPNVKAAFLAAYRDCGIDIMRCYVMNHKITPLMTCAEDIEMYEQARREVMDETGGYFV